MLWDIGNSIFVRYSYRMGWLDDTWYIDYHWIHHPFRFVSTLCIVIMSKCQRNIWVVLRYNTMHIFLHPNLKFLNLISDLANKDDRPAIIFQLLLQFDLVLLGWNQFNLLSFILIFFTFGWLLNRMARSEIIVIKLK